MSDKREYRERSCRSFISVPFEWGTFKEVEALVSLSLSSARLEKPFQNVVVCFATNDDDCLSAAYLIYIFSPRQHWRQRKSTIWSKSFKRSAHASKLIRKFSFSPQKLKLARLPRRCQAKGFFVLKLSPPSLRLKSLVLV